MVKLQVSRSKGAATPVRAWSARATRRQTWDLRCEVREKLILFLQEEFPGALPKQRAELIDLSAHRRAAVAE